MSDTLSPMMQQYQGIRRTLPPDTLLLFRLGDFYEMFFEDAKEASAILNVALTKRNGVPMCGVPYHAAEGYMAKLIKAGKRAAICDQVGEVVPGRIVQREVTQIISPGTISDLNLLEAKRNNYLAAIFAKEDRYGFAYVDLSTGEFRQFLGIARGSNCELQTQLEIARALGYGNAKIIEEAEGLSIEVGKMINAILQSLST